jgi:2-C-methyl-D-erythritol 4-phosphate cytidylyltransferase
MKASVLIPAAGRGVRMGADVNKQYLPLAGKPILARSIAACLATRCFSDIIVIVTPGEEEQFRRDVLLPFFPNQRIITVPGGRERQDSVRNGLQAVSAGTGLVCIHDGARPLVKPALFRHCLDEAEKTGAAIAAVPVKDTIKTVSGSRVLATPPRDTLWAVQTPQAFLLERLAQAHEKAAREGFCATDDAALLEHYGYPVHVVLGDYENIKVTTPDDLVLAEAFWGRRQNENRDRV